MLTSLRGALALAGSAGLLVLVASACGPAAATGPAAASPTASTPLLPTASAVVIASPTIGTGFAFDAESVTGYYVTQGYICTGPQPSALAEGYAFTSCELTDPAGRRLVIGVVTDPADELADGFASVTGTAEEQILDPAIALQPLGGFLGAMLGPERGEALLQWLASHLGDDYAETTAGDLKVATYIKGDDHSTLYVELANDAYLNAPRPSPSPSG